MKKHIVAISVLAFSLTGCSSVSDNANSAHYTMSDYYSVNKIDAHVHANSTSAAFIEQAQKDNIKLLSI
ncbi:MAG: hypothetical protein ACTH3B_12095, partial [Pseudoalteromonas sp.]